MMRSWWDKWFAEDFSWEGLARNKLWAGWLVTSDLSVVESATGRRYGGPPKTTDDNSHVVVGRPATLQDYWRADPLTGRLRSDEAMRGELEVREGYPTYHRVHLPLLYADGSPTEKASWKSEALDEFVNTRLQSTSDSKWQKGRFSSDLIGGDNRAQFQGGVWLVAPRPPQSDRPIAARYEHSAFINDASFENAEFTESVSFKNALFVANARFQGSRFANLAWFGSTTFCREARFKSATFDHDVSFEEAQFLGYASFEKTELRAYASFSGATFSHDVRFVNANFHSETFFTKTAFRGLAAFENASLHPGATFDRAAFTAIQRVSSKAWAAGACLGVVFGTALQMTSHDTAIISVSGGAIAVCAFCALLIWFLFGGSWLAEKQGIDLERHARAFRVLAQHMEAARNRPDLARFYRHELTAIRMRSTTNPLERLFSVFYDVAASYGDSVARPFVALAIVASAFALFFGVPLSDRDNIAYAIWFSAMNIIKPMHVWTLEFSKGQTDLAGTEAYWAWVAQKFSSTDPYAQLALRAVASLESALALALLFLIALSIRRKFQIT